MYVIVHNKNIIFLSQKRAFWFLYNAGIKRERGFIHMQTIKSEERNVSHITFEALFKQHYAYVVKQIIWIIKEQTVAEELAQEVFLQLYHSDWKSIENLRAWLIKSSTYVAYNYIRSEKRHQARIDKETQYQEVQIDSSLDDEWIRKEEITKVQIFQCIR